MDSIVYSPLLVITLVAIVSYIPRGLGAFLSGHIDAEGSLVEWITCIAYALMAGLVVRMIVLPIGALVATPLWMRLGAVGFGLIVFYATRKSIGLGVLCGSLALTALVWGFLKV
jgi:branched-subunit amino acid transport protein